MNLAFRLRKLNAGSDYYGNCECCDRSVGTTYLMVTFEGYAKRECETPVDGYRYVSEKFGHRECLEALTLDSALSEAA